MRKFKIKKGDKVIVITGKYKNAIGNVIEVFKQDDKVLVEGVNISKKHLKSNNPSVPSSIIDKTLPIHISNVSLIDEKTNKPSKAGYKFENGKKVRILKSSKEVI